MSSTEIDPLNDGISFVRLVEAGGNELSIVNAARVSLHNESKWEIPDAPEWENPELCRQLSARDRGLINFLLKSKHGSPFEHNFMAFHIRLPIVVMREHVRHRIGFSINEESGRYVEMRPDFYYPDHLRKQEGKPGAYTFVRWDDPEELQEYIDDLIEVNELQWKYYQKWLGKDLAKEQARNFLGLNLYTECRWTANARSLMNYLNLRNASDAQWEIRQYAKAIEELFSRHMPNVYKSFIDNDRIAP